MISFDVDMDAKCISFVLSALIFKLVCLIHRKIFLRLERYFSFPPFTISYLLVISAIIAVSGKHCLTPIWRKKHNILLIDLNFLNRIWRSVSNHFDKSSKVTIGDFLLAILFLRISRTRTKVSTVLFVFMSPNILCKMISFSRRKIVLFL